MKQRAARPRSALCLAGLLTTATAAMQAHDPGLSSLELAVTSSRIVAIVSVAAPDAAIILASHRKTAPTPESGADTERLGSFALGAISIRVDGRALQGRVQRVDIDDTGGRVQIGYRATPGSRIAVSSAIPRWLTAGHRELLSIRNAEGSVLVQQMLDAQSGDSVTELRRASSSSRGLVSFLLAGVLLLLAGGGRMARRLAAAEWPSGGSPWSIRSSATDAMIDRITDVAASRRAGARTALTRKA